MLNKTNDSGLTYPFSEPPAQCQTVEVASGILWLRLPLPFRLDHINIYLIEDGHGLSC